jgi:hypothetical protein
MLTRIGRWCRTDPKPARRRPRLGLESLEFRDVPAMTIGVNFAGQTDTQFAPPDSDGSVGPNHYVQFINGHFSIYTKAGAQVSTESDSTFWTAAGVPSNLVSQGLSDTRVLYDPLSDRWFATEINVGSDGPNGQLPVNNSIFVARSDTNDPTGTWTALTFPAAFPSEFADYPTLGVDNNAIYIGVNNFFFSLIGDSVTVTSIPKADMLLPTPTVVNRTTVSESVLNDQLGYTLQGVTDFNAAATHGSNVAVDANLFGQIDRTQVTGAAGPAAVFGAPTAMTAQATSLPHNAHQPDGSRKIDGGDDRIGAMVYQVGDLIYLVHSITVDKTGAATKKATGTDAIRLTVISDSQDKVVAEATHFDPNFDYIYPSVSANAAGDIVIGFTRSARKLNSGATSGTLGAYALHAIIDPANTGAGIQVGTDIQLKDGQVKNYHLFGGRSERWGDFSATGVDPSSSTTFWTTQEYAVAKGQWGTEVTQLLVSPGLMGITSPAVAGTYGLGSVIPIQVKFVSPVVVTGIPRLLLNAGNGAAAVYASGSGTDTLTFNYTVQPGQNIGRLDYANGGALVLDGGSINDASTGLPARLNLSPTASSRSLAAAAHLAVDTGGLANLVAPTDLGIAPAMTSTTKPQRKPTWIHERPLGLIQHGVHTTAGAPKAAIPGGVSVEGLTALVDAFGGTTRRHVI